MKLKPETFSTPLRSARHTFSLLPAGARVKLHVAGTVNKLNVEHRTSNSERPIWMALCFI